MNGPLRLLLLLPLLIFSAGCERQNLEVQVQGGAGGNNGSIIVDGILIEDLVATIRREPNLSFFADALEFTRLNLLFRDQSSAFTITVPTDTAFNHLGNAQRAALLSNPDDMRSLLLRHASPVVRSSSEIEATGLAMLDGSNRSFNNSTFVARDLQATNGVVHIIDIVFSVPTGDASSLTVNQALSADGRFSGLVAALRLVGLTETLDNPTASYTLFAPTNAAFFSLRESIGNDGLTALYRNQPELQNLLNFHLITGTQLGIADFGGNRGATFTAANGDQLSLADLNGRLLVEGVQILPSPIVANNGIIYAIETVLQP